MSVATSISGPRSYLEILSSEVLRMSYIKSLDLSKWMLLALKSMLTLLDRRMKVDRATSCVQRASWMQVKIDRLVYTTSYQESYLSVQC